MPILPTRAYLIAAVLMTASAPPYAAEESSQQALQQQFEAAMDNRESGKIYDAIRMFEDMLNTNPYLNRARLELAVAYHEASRYEDAMKQFKIVLDDPNTPESVRLSILAYLGQLASDEMQPEGRHAASYYIKAGLIHNSNINTVPGVGSIIVNGREFFLPNAEISSAGTDIVLSASHRYRRKTPMNVAGAKTLFEWQSQASLSSNLYTETSDYNLNVASVSTGPAFISPGRWHAAIPVRFDQVYLGSGSLGSAIALRPHISFDLGHYRGLLIESNLLSRSYADAVNAPQEGTLVMAGAAYTTLLTSLSTGLEAGFRLRSRSAEDDQFSYDGSELYFSGYTTVSSAGSVYLKGFHRTFEYLAPDTLIASGAVTREDSESSLALGYNLDLSGGMLSGWTLNMEASYTKNQSNIDAYDYDRLLVTANMSKYIQ